MRLYRLIVISFTFLLCVIIKNPVFAYTTGQAADLVLGQQNFTSGNYSNTLGPNTLYNPGGYDYCK